MSKEKLSAEEWARVCVQVSDEDGKIPWDELDSVNTSEVFKLMEAYAQYKTEQLQRDKIAAFTLLMDGVEAFTSGDSNNRMTWISQASIFLTPKPEK